MTGEVEQQRLAGRGVAQSFPFGERDPDAPSQPRVTEVTLRHATGTLVCDAGG